MDPVQILLFTVVGILTILLTVVGVQVFLILKDFKKTVYKMNKILDDTQVLTNSVAKPVAGLVNIVEGVKNFKNVFDFVSHRTDELIEHTKKKKDESPQTLSDEHIFLQSEESPLSNLQERGRRFFHRDGKPLTS